MANPSHDQRDAGRGVRVGRDMRVRRDVRVDAGGVDLPGYLWTPPAARGLVVFAHGSGSGRDSSRNQHVARRLNDIAFATLLFDLLTEPEAADRANVFDIGLLARRLVGATRWTRGQDDVGRLPVGLFGASTGAAAALTAAVELGDVVGAVVSRGGRPDLCDRLEDVNAPVLLIVGGHDHMVLDLNHDAAARLTTEHAIEVVAGATHLFEEPGTLDTAAEHAGRWFAEHL